MQDHKHHGWSHDLERQSVCSLLTGGGGGNERKDNDKAAVVTEEIQDWVRHFPVSEASLLRRRDLLRRVDTKFVTPADRLEGILAGLEGYYAKVLAKGASWAAYKTLYFDTEAERFFHDHRRGRLARHKVRVRHYVDRQVTFFEVKLKSNRRITTKLRQRKEFGCSSLDRADLALAAKVPAIPVSEVVPRLWTMFYRLILVGRENLERVTIDLGVTFRHGETGDGAALDDLATTELGNRPLLRNPGGVPRALAVIEVKQPSFRSRTPIMLALRREGVQRRSSSKYCTGVLLTNPVTRANSFLPNLKQIARLQCSSS